MPKEKPAAATSLISEITTAPLTMDPPDSKAQKQSAKEAHKQAKKNAAQSVAASIEDSTPNAMPAATEDPGQKEEKAPLAGRLIRQALKVSKSLPAAADDPTPRKVVTAAKDFDGLRDLVWEPLTETDTYQNLDGRMKEKHGFLHTSKRVALEGPFMTIMKRREEKKQVAALHDEKAKKR